MSNRYDIGSEVRWQWGNVPRLLPGVLCAAVVGAFVLSGCQPTPPETELQAADEALGEATIVLAELDTRIEQTEDLLDDLRAERREQRDTVRTLEQRLEARATDVAIFRAVQTALLDDEQLHEVAISADVEDRVVSLGGVVRSEEEARRAATLAAEVPGVDGVTSRIRVDDPQAGSGTGK